MKSKTSIELFSYNKSRKISEVKNKPFTLFNSLSNDMHNEILSHLGLIDRLPLTLVSNQFSTQLPEGIQIQSLAKKTLEQLANDEAILWIDKQLVSQTPDELIRNICKRTNSIPDDLIKKTVFTILVERGANLKDDENPLLVAYI